jgi:hypothetical protein
MIKIACLMLLLVSIHLIEAKSNYSFSVKLSDTNDKSMKSLEHFVDYLQSKSKNRNEMNNKVSLQINGYYYNNYINLKTQSFGELKDYVHNYSLMENGSFILLNRQISINLEFNSFDLSKQQAIKEFIENIEESSFGFFGNNSFKFRFQSEFEFSNRNKFIQYMSKLINEPNNVIYQ